MRKTIKDVEVIAYKGMNSDMTCKGFHYEIGKSYKTDKAELRKCGFHAYLNPIEVFDYYSRKTKSRYFKVKLSGEITKCDYADTEVAATEITILEEINIDEVINNTEWWKNNNVLDLLYYQENFAIVQRSDKQYNFINKNGKFLSDEWFRWVDFFKGEFARVKRTNCEWNFIDKDGKIISDEWFYWIDNFYDGLATVQRANGECCKIDKNGKLIKKLQ